MLTRVVLLRTAFSNFRWRILFAITFHLVSRPPGKTHFTETCLTALTRLMASLQKLREGCVFFGLLWFMRVPFASTCFVHSPYRRKPRLLQQTQRKPSKRRYSEVKQSVYYVKTIPPRSSTLRRGELRLVSLSLETLECVHETEQCFWGWICQQAKPNFVQLNFWNGSPEIIFAGTSLHKMAQIFFLKIFSSGRTYLLIFSQ